MLALFQNIFKKRVVRYIFAGGTGAFVNLGVLYLLVHVAHVWYLLATSTAFVISFCVSFLLQKFFTFGDRSSDRTTAQLLGYLLVALINLGVNDLLMYIQVDLFSWHYMVAQFIASALVALYSFFVYRQLFSYKPSISK